MAVSSRNVTRFFLAPTLVLLLLVAGCVGGEPTESAALGVEETGAGIQGLVVSEELFPVAGALVSIVHGSMTQTDRGGRFELHNLRPGEATLNVTAEGYEPLQQKISVPDEGMLDLQLVLVGIPGQSPYLTTLIYDGFSACTFSFVYSAGPTGSTCPFGTPRTTTLIEVGSDWRAGVHEVTWRSSEEMIFASSLSPTCALNNKDPCPHLGWGRSPLKAIAVPEDVDYAKKHALDGKTTWPQGAHQSHMIVSYSGYLREDINRTAYPACSQINRMGGVPEHWGCPFGIGYSTGLRFTIYHTTFYREAPLALRQFTALPDQ